MLANLLRPQVDLAALILRSGLAALFIVHGILKIVQQFPLGPQLSLEEWTLVGWVELICGIALLVGLFSRIAALILGATQVGAILLVTGKFALANPSVDRSGANYRVVGPEYNLAIIVMCFAVLVLGSGFLSLDHALLAWWHRRNKHTGAPLVPMQAKTDPGLPA